MRPDPVFRLLREVVDAALEEGLVLVAGDVLGDVGAGALGVAHLAEDAGRARGQAVPLGGCN